MRFGVLRRGLVVVGLRTGHPAFGLAQIRVDALAFHGLVILGVHHHVRLPRTQKRLASDGERELGDLLLVDEALARRVGVQAAEQPVAVVLVDVVPVLSEGAAGRGRRNRAALVAEHREVAIERSTRIEYHLDARAVGKRVAQREHRRVEHLPLQVLPAQEAARAHHHVRRQHIDARVSLHAAHRAVLDKHLLATRAVQKLAACGLNGLHEGRHALFALALKIMAGAEPVAVHIGPQRHGHVEIDHRVERVARARQAVAQQRAVHACAREIVHVAEQGVERHRLALLFLQLRLASGRTPAHREVRHGCRWGLLHNDHALARFSQLERGHEARRSRADDAHVALLRGASLHARDGFLRTPVRGPCGILLIRRGGILLPTLPRRAPCKPRPRDKRTRCAQSQKRSAIHNRLHSISSSIRWPFADPGHPALRLSGSPAVPKPASPSFACCARRRRARTSFSQSDAQHSRETEARRASPQKEAMRDLLGRWR